MSMSPTSVQQRDDQCSQRKLYTVAGAFSALAFTGVVMMFTKIDLLNAFSMTSLLALVSAALEMFADPRVAPRPFIFVWAMGILCGGFGIPLVLV